MSASCFASPAVSERLSDALLVAIFSEKHSHAAYLLSMQDVARRLRRETAVVPGIDAYYQAVQNIQIGGRSAKADIQYTLQSADLNTLIAQVPGLVERLKKRPELRDVTNGIADGLSATYPFALGDDVFWQTGSTTYPRIRVNPAGAGQHELLSYGDDTTRGATDLGTDGTTMVWVEGANRTNSTSVFTDVAIYQAPYSTDAATLAATKHIVRTGLSGYPFGVSPFVVNCGYALRLESLPETDGGFRVGLILVRLSDGAGWFFGDMSPSVFRWREALMLTCDEMFALVESRSDGGPPHFNVARMRLDSLGSPDLPPDVP